MLKINKFIKITRNFPEISRIRFYSQSDRCVKHDSKKPRFITDPEDAKFKDLYYPDVLLPQHPGNPNFFRNIFLFVCVPIILCALIYTNSAEKPKRMKFVPFEYLRLRKGTNVFGERTLFHHPYYNALPSGYETEESEDMELDPFDEPCSPGK